MTRFVGLRSILIVAAGVMLGVQPTGLQAQEPDGFLFRRPNLTLTGRIGAALPALNGDLVDFTTERLTVSRSDFNAPFLGGELAVLVLPRLDLILNAGYAGARLTSELREWVGEDDLPIVQETVFHSAYLTGGAKLYLGDRGLRAGSFAWIPSKVAPYVSGAVGGAWYRFEQEGEFVDFESLDIFFDRFMTQGTGFMVQAALGLDVSVGNRWFLNGEGRYGWATAGLEQDFVGFGDVDLSGVRVSVGVGVRL